MLLFRRTPSKPSCNGHLSMPREISLLFFPHDPAIWAYIFNPLSGIFLPCQGLEVLNARQRKKRQNQKKKQALISRLQPVIVKQDGKSRGCDFHHLRPTHGRAHGRRRCEVPALAHPPQPFTSTRLPCSQPHDYPENTKQPPFTTTRLPRSKPHGYPAN